MVGVGLVIQRSAAGIRRVEKLGSAWDRFSRRGNKTGFYSCQGIARRAKVMRPPFFRKERQEIGSDNKTVEYLHAKQHEIERRLRGLKAEVSSIRRGKSV